MSQIVPVRTGLLTKILIKTITTFSQAIGFYQLYLSTYRTVVGVMLGQLTSHACESDKIAAWKYIGHTLGVISILEKIRNNFSFERNCCGALKGN